MAAYDLIVQKPSTLAIPNSPGADDLARFLSVSESARANQANEGLKKEALGWEMGAPQRALEAAEAERERTRQQNIEFEKALAGSTEGYISSAAENYRLSEEAVGRFMKEYPNATQEQVDQVRQRARQQITQSPDAFIRQADMYRQVESDLLSRGYDRATASAAAKERVSSYFSPTPEGPDKEVVKGFMDVIKNAGLMDHIGDLSISQGANGGIFLNSSKGGSDGGYKGSEEFRKASEFVTKHQLNNPNNQFKEGAEGFWDNWFGNDSVFKDDANALAAGIRAEKGIKPQYVLAALEGITSNGKLPDGVSSKDLRNPESSLYQNLSMIAQNLQAQYEGGSGNQGISLERLTGLVQGDTEMKIKALNDVLAMTQRRKGSPLTADEQYRIMSNPRVLEELGIALNAPLQQQAGTASVAPPEPSRSAGGNSGPSANPNPEPVIEDRSVQDPGTSTEATDPIAAVLGGSGDSSVLGDTNPAAAQGSPTNRSYNDMLADFGRMLEDSRQRSGNGTPASSQTDNRSSGNPDTEGFSGFFEDSQPGVPWQNKRLLGSVSDGVRSLGRALDSGIDLVKERGIAQTARRLEVFAEREAPKSVDIEKLISDNPEALNRLSPEVIKMLEQRYGKKLIDKYLDSPPKQSSRNSVPQGRGGDLSSEELNYDPDRSEIISGANGSEQVDLNRRLLRSLFPDMYS